MTEYGFPQFGSIEHGVAVEPRVQKIAREIRAACGQTRAVPFDPRACAEYFGLEVEGVDLPGGLSGRLSFFGESPKIEFCRTHSALRVRFTICHELGHLCFLDKKPVLPKERGDIDTVPRSQGREERLCNMIAAELLMPPALFSRVATTLRPSIESIGKLQQEFGVSTAALIRRLCDLGLWSVGFADWIVTDGVPPKRCWPRRIVVKKAVRRGQEQQQVLRQIENALDRAEGLIVRSSSSGHNLREEWTKEMDAITLNIAPYRHATNRGIRVLALHR